MRLHPFNDFELPKALRLAARRHGARLTPDLLLVSVRTQRMFRCTIIKRSCESHRAATRRYHVQRTYVISTSRFGTGQLEGSNRTPLGLHRIVEKIGAGWPVGTVFRSRKPIGYTWKPVSGRNSNRAQAGSLSPSSRTWRGLPGATITTRILWLEGLEPGFNRGGNIDSHARYIYIHGTGDETSLGRPASCGCIHMRADDLMPLFDSIPAGTLVWIQP